MHSYDHAVIYTREKEMKGGGRERERERNQEKKPWSEIFKDNTIIIRVYGLCLYCFTKHLCLHDFIWFTLETLELGEAVRLV